MKLLAVLFLLIALVDAQKPIKPVNKEIVVESVQFAVFERDLTESKEYATAKAYEKLPGSLQVDAHKKIQLKFTIRDKKSNTIVNVHQAFVALVHAATKREVIYVAEADKTTRAYTFELDMKTNHKDFAGVSGKYTVRLILGDASISNPVDWSVTEVTVNVPMMEPVSIPKSKQIGYEKLPEIKHQFREQEQQPPVAVSHLFAALCALPFLILFALWLRVGINISNIKLSLWALGFHLGLASIFALYFLYWQKLNMFQTLQYLSLTGTITFVCGNRLLHSFNSDQKQKNE